MKTAKKIICLGVAIVMLLGVFSGCGKGDDRGLKFSNVNDGEPAPPIWFELTSEKSKLKVGEDLTIKIYYAPQSRYDTSVYDPAPVSVSAIIFMGHGTYERKLVQKGEHTYTQPEYTFEYEGIEQITFKEIDNFANANNYPVAGSSTVAFETVVIPAGWFIGEMGGIGWSLTARLAWADDNIGFETQGGGITLYYKIEGENIILYDSYYNFFNDIRK